MNLRQRLGSKVERVGCPTSIKMFNFFFLTQSFKPTRISTKFMDESHRPKAVPN